VLRRFSILFTMLLEARVFGKAVPPPIQASVGLMLLGIAGLGRFLPANQWEASSRINGHATPNSSTTMLVSEQYPPPKENGWLNVTLSFPNSSR